MPNSVMVIDDSREILNLFNTILTEAGFAVHLYAFGMHELEEVKRVGPDLIVLDFLIGDEGPGWQMLQKLKMDRSTADIPVIVCSGAVKQLREMEMWLLEKRVGIVYKPFNVDDLLLVVHKMLEEEAAAPPDEAAAPPTAAPRAGADPAGPCYTMRVGA